MFRIGLIGAGGMGSFHARSLAEISNAEVTVVADPFADSALKLATELQSQYSLDPDSLIDDPEVDAVVIASPDETHAELTLAAMAAGKRVLCEKPLATSVADARAVVDAEVRLGKRVVQLGFMREYDLPHRQVLDAIAQDSQLYLVRSLHRNTNAESRSDLAVVGQSIVHDIHSLRFMSGQEIVAVSAYASRRDDQGLRHVVLVADLDGGGHGIAEFDDDGFAYEVCVDVTTEAGTVTTAGPVRAIERRDAKIATNIGRDWFGWFADAYRTQDAAWVRSLGDDSASGPSAWDGLAAQIVVDAALKSLSGGGRVAVDLPPKPDLYSLSTSR